MKLVLFSIAISAAVLPIMIFIIKQLSSIPQVVPINKKTLGTSGQKFLAHSSPTISSPSSTLVLAPTNKVLKKKSYTIALFGDSMIDTMGENLEYLQEALNYEYPTTTFKLYNYGIGGQNVSEGLARFDSPFTNRERQYEPISKVNADIIILGSFAYNPFPTHDKNKHFEELSLLVKKAKNVTNQVYVLAEIAPLKSGFGVGKNGINWPENLAHEHALRIIEQLDNAVLVSKSENIPLINAYYHSRIDGIFGDPSFVNIDDGIHPSQAGHIFMANLIVKTVSLL